MRFGSDFERMFYPQSVAFVGVSGTSIDKHSFMSAATGFMVRLLDRGFKGRVYPVNPKLNEILGMKVYPTLTDIPEPADLVIVAVPATAVPSVLEDCILAGIKNLVLFTAGFEETGEKEGKKLAEQTKEIIHRGGLHVVGPNCMGIYVPGAALSMWPEGVTEGGNVAFVSQSGRLAQDYAEYAQYRGIKFSKSISFGNAYGLDESDFLEYLGNDPETKVIGMYLEGVSNGERLMKVARNINRSKPIMLWKGGLTEAGAKAARSHTGSMSGQEQIWDGFFRQTGVLKASCLEDIADFHLAFLNLPPASGKRVAHLDVGGGSSVASADVYARAGLELPTLSKKTLRELRRFIPSAGTSIMNPLDIAGVMRDTSLLERTLDLVASDPLVDIIVITQHWLMLWFTRGKVIHPMAEYLAEFVKQNRYGKPVVAVTRCWTEAEEGRGWLMEMDRALLDAGIPTYPTEERAIKSLSRLAKYHSFLAESPIT